MCRMMFLFLVAAVVLIGCNNGPENDEGGGGGGGPGVVEGGGNDATVTRGIFDAAIRAGLSFQPDNSGDLSKIALTNELRLLEPSIKTKPDRDLYVVLKKVEQIQKDRQFLAGISRGLRDTWGRLRSGAEENYRKMLDTRAEYPNAESMQKVASLFEATEEAYRVAVAGDAILLKGGVIVELGTQVQLFSDFKESLRSSRLPEIMKRYNISPMTVDGFRYFLLSPVDNNLEKFEMVLMDSAIEIAT